MNILIGLTVILTYLVHNLLDLLTPIQRYAVCLSREKNSEWSRKSTALRALESPGAGPNAVVNETIMRDLLL